MAAAFTIRPGHAADSDAVLRINAGSAPHVSSLDAAGLEDLTAMDGCFLVAEAKGAAIGYLIALAPGAAYDGEEFLWLGRNFPRSLYVDQVAVAAEWRRHGVAKQMYAAAAACARERGLRQLGCEVNLRPANPVSLHFHRAMGFSQAGTLHVSDGRYVSLQLRELR